MPSSTGTLVFNDQKIQAPDIYATESLGVGVSDPTSNLEVVGNAYVSSNLEVGTANLFVDTTTGNVGVGTANPNDKLHVNGHIRIASNKALTLLSTDTFSVNGDSMPHYGLLWRDHTAYTGGPTMQMSGYGGIRMFTQANERVTILNNGNVGIGSTTPGAKLDVNGYILNNNPVFHAYQTGGASTTNSGVYNAFTSTYINRGGHYYTSGTNQGKFIAPVAGVYYFSANMLQREKTANNNAELTFYKNGTNVSVRALGYTYVVGNLDHDNLHIEMMIELAVGDYVQVAIHVISSGTDFYVGESLANFRGFLIG